MVIIAVTRILPVIQSILLVVKLPQSLALTFNKMDRASMEMTAAFLTQKMLQKNLLLMVLLTMQEVVVAVEEEGEEGVVVEEAEAVAVVDVELLLLLPQQPLRLLLVLLLLLVHLLKRRMMRNKSPLGVVADVDEEANRVMRVPKRKKKRRKILRSLLFLMKPRNSTRMERNSVETSAIVANATSGTNAISLTRPDR
jgi:hypothetical protein